MMRQVGKTIRKLFFTTMALLIAMGGYSSAAYAQLSVTVDRTEITDVDLVKLTVRLSNTTTASNPSFSALERDFDIVQRSGPNQSSRISIVNGRQTSEVNVSWELRLRPKRLGTLTIPGFRMGSHTSAPIRIEVKRQSEAMKRKMSQLVFFDTSVDTTQTYVQGQILYTIKLYYVENISGDFPPMPAIEDAVVEVIEDESRYDTVTNGRRYYVLEKRYGIYPQKSGELTIPSQSFSGYRVGPGFFSTREPVLARSESHRIEVQPKPASFTGTHWLPASNLTIETKWLTDPDFTVGEPVNRAIEIQAEGVAVSLLPELPEPQIDGVKTYQDPPAEEQQLTSSGIISKQTVVVGIVPTRAGKLTLPEISIPWWNTRTNQLENAIIPAETFTVAPSPQSAVVAPSAAPVIAGAGSDDTREAQANEPFWQYLTYGVSVLWLVTLILWFMTYKNKRPGSHSAALSGQAPSTDSPSLNNSWRAFEAACKSADGHSAQRHLTVWANLQFGNVRALQDLNARIQSVDLNKAIVELEAALYSQNGSGSWNGKKLLEAARALKAEAARHGSKDTSDRGLIGHLNPS